MTESTAGFAVFLFEQAVEALGEAIRPYLQDGPAGPHIACQAVDTGGAFVEMTVDVRREDGTDAQVELMVPMQMVRMVVSIRSDEAFGFGLHSGELSTTQLPAVGPGAPPARAPSSAVPSTASASAGTPVAATARQPADDRLRPPEG